MEHRTVSVFFGALFLLLGLSNFFSHEPRTHEVTVIFRLLGGIELVLAVVFLSEAVRSTLGLSRGVRNAGTAHAGSSDSNLKKKE